MGFFVCFRIVANKESKYNEKIEELKGKMLELEVMLWVSSSLLGLHVNQ